MDLELAGVPAIVLGSSSGLGKAVAAGLIAEGARVAVVSRSLDRARAVADELGAAAALAGDLSVPGEAGRLVDDAVAALGGLTIGIINTGGGKPGPILSTAGADDAAYHSMLRPVLEFSRAAAPHVMASGRGRLLYLTARSVVEATPELSLSSVFRSGVAAAARSLALELAPDATANVVVTGQFDTPALGRFEAARSEHEGRTAQAVRAEHVAAIPMRRVGTAQEFADVVVFHCSARASFVNGSVIRIDGGAVRGF